MNKLNLGCGANHLEGYINIDVRIPKMKEPDYVCDITKLPYKNNMIDEIVCFHAFEHLSKNDGIRAAKSWFNMLVPNGKLVIECPDIIELCKKVCKSVAVSTTTLLKPISINNIVKVFSLQPYR